MAGSARPAFKTFLKLKTKEINLEKIVKATKRNFYQIMGMLKDYRKMKLKEGGDIKEFEIPKLTITDHRR